MLIHLTLLAPLAFSPLAPMQEADVAQRQEPVSAVEYYTPQRAPAQELTRVVSNLFAQGGIGTTFGQAELPPTLITYGKAIVVRYRDDKIGELVKLLRDLDAQWSGEQGTRSDEDLMTLEYRARHVTMNSLAGALAPFSHPITVSDGAMRYQVQNLSYLEERGLIVARGPKQEIAQIESVLKRIDLPQQQVLITCFLIRGLDEAGSEARLPKALTDNLVKLVPFAGFESLAMGILRSDSLAKMQMVVDYALNEQFVLELRPRAFDPSSQSLTLDQCEFGLSRGDGPERSSQRFTTSASIRAGEYTVLGAVGSEPIFVVLHLSLVGS